MRYAMLYNIFVCWMVSGMGLLTARAILSKREEDLATKGFGYFWLFSSGLWLCSGLRHLFFFFHYQNLDIALFYFVQIFLGIHLMAAAVFLTYKSFSNERLNRWFLIALGCLTCVFLFFFFLDGIQQTKTSPWANEHMISDRAFLFFLPGYIYCIVLTIYAIIRTVGVALMRGTLDRKGFFALAALFLYEAAGIFDVHGGVADYRLMIIRGIYMISALISYLSFAWESSTIQIVQAGKKGAS